MTRDIQIDKRLLMPWILVALVSFFQCQIFANAQENVQEPDITSAEIEEALSAIVSDPRDTVRYDGVNGTHVYSGIDLRRKVLQAYLALTNLARISDPTERRRVIRGVPEELRIQFARDTLTTDPRTALEPVDLLMTFEKEDLIRSAWGDAPPPGYHATLNDLIRGAIASLLEVPFSQGELDYAIVSDSNRVIDYRLFCKHPDFEFEMQEPNVERYGGDVARRILPYRKSTVVANTSNYRASFRCGGRSYTIRSEVHDLLGTLNPSQESDWNAAFDRGVFNTVISYSITEGVPEEYINWVKFAFASQGYSTTMEQGEETDREDYLTDLNNADFLVVTDTVLTQSLCITSGNSRRLIFEKEIVDPQNSERTAISRVVLYYSESTSYRPGIRISEDELTDTFRSRREDGRGPLTILHLRCSSIDGILRWMRIYRKSVRDEEGNLATDPTGLNDIPFVIGTHAGFNAHSEDTIRGILVFFFQSLGALTNGNTFNELMGFLNTPTPERRDFEPVSCHEFPRSFELGGRVELIIEPVVD